MSRLRQHLRSFASPLTEQHAGLVREYLRKTGPLLSAFHISQIYMWQVRFELWYAIIGRRLCIFFAQEPGCFMFLPPLGKAPTRRILTTCLGLMNRANEGAALSRFENVPLDLAAQCRAWGFEVRARPGEYVYERHRVAALAGNAFKSKRAAINRFCRVYAPRYRAYASADYDGCRELLRRWFEKRQAVGSDYVYRCLLEDTVAAQESSLARASQWDLSGRVVETRGKIVGYTFGYAINTQTWCVLFETCDPLYDGAAAYLFREFCAEMSGHRWVNCLDDSGLKNVRRAKQSYRPYEQQPVYAVAPAAPENSRGK